MLAGAGKKRAVSFPEFVAKKNKVGFNAFKFKFFWPQWHLPIRCSAQLGIHFFVLLVSNFSSQLEVLLLEGPVTHTQLMRINMKMEER